MPNLKDIKKRIKSVKNTQKITQAMKMVAAAKVKKAEKKVLESRPFSNELNKVFHKLLESTPDISETNLQVDKAIDNYPKLLAQRELKTVGLLVVTSDKGLAGAYNANIIKKAISRKNELEKDGIKTKMFIVGAKGIGSLKRTDADIVKTYSKLPPVPTHGASNLIAEDIAESFVSGEIDRIEVLTTRFKSMLSFEVQLWEVLPVRISKTEKAEEISPEMMYEPTPEVILQKTVPLYISNRIYQGLLEAAASELASRMSAMSTATTNAGDMISHLELVYNKARQGAITQELLEVVAGAEALNG